MKHAFAALAAGGLLLAQASGYSSYNGGIPMTPGTRVPESSPVTVAPALSGAAPGSSPAAAPAISSGGAAVSAPSGPAYSFGAAPAPVVGPSH